MEDSNVGEYETTAPVKQIGLLWIIPGPTHGFVVGYYKKPNFFHRWMFSFLLGWEFVPDNKSTD